MVCPDCAGDSIVRDFENDEDGIDAYECHDCGAQFTELDVDEQDVEGRYE